MEQPDIRPDKLYEIPIYDGNEGHELLINAKYDRMDVYRPLGIWILKCLDLEDGIVQVVMEESQAKKLAAFALLPIVERDFLYQSEHEMYLDAIASRLDDIFGAE